LKSKDGHVFKLVQIQKSNPRPNNAISALMWLPVALESTAILI